MPESFDNAEQARTDRQELLNLQALAGSLAGLCIMGVTIYVSSSKTDRAMTVADDLLVGAGLSFMICVYLVYLALRPPAAGPSARMRRWIDGLFHGALLSMVVSGFLMVYTDL